ncbi:MAG: hypothetical protein AAGF45_10385, partial [Pseudomonadota bacterium]
MRAPPTPSMLGEAPSPLFAKKFRQAVNKWFAEGRCEGYGSVEIHSLSMIWLNTLRGVAPFRPIGALEGPSIKKRDKDCLQP